MGQPGKRRYSRAAGVIGTVVALTLGAAVLPVRGDGLTPWQAPTVRSTSAAGLRVELAYSRQQLRFNVSCGSSPVEGATVCLWKAGDVYEVETTNPAGEASFGFVPESGGTMFVTVVCHNCLPYEGQAQVDGQRTPGDLDGDVVDLLALLSEWGDCPAPPAACPGDLNDDGVVDVLDLLILLGNWT